MKRTTILALLACALPIAAWASMHLFDNERGTISISESGIESKGSQLVRVGQIGPPPGHSLGPVKFTTGPLISGTLSEGGKFSSLGSSFVVIGRGNYGEPKGTIFVGAFHEGIHWTLISKNGANLVFELRGTVQGQLWNGRQVRLQTKQTIITTEEQLAKGIGHILIGKTTAP